jgi:UDP-galactopyranose mutase
MQNFSSTTSFLIPLRGGTNGIDPAFVSWVRLHQPINGAKVRELSLIEDNMLHHQNNSGISQLFEDGADSDLVVFSHLRWDFVFQRPQHLMSRFSKVRRVYFVEEPLMLQFEQPHLRLTQKQENLWVAVPCLPISLNESEKVEEIRKLVDELIRQEEIENFTSWYYTPMAIPFTRHLEPDVVIYDCMDELSAFRGAPPELLELEQELLEMAHLVYTGGRSLYLAKQPRHRDVHCFPSSIDFAHFARARSIRKEISARRDGAIHIGFYGVIDERFDLELLRDVAKLRPEWHFDIIGPVVKIDPASLPQASNIHYLGMKNYAELPDHLARWDIAILPFARNESTRFISPTKTPEYLAAGCPAVSTSIEDVIRPYGEEGLVQIADAPADFVVACEKALKQAESPEWRKRVDTFLSDKSWDHTCAQMLQLEQHVRDAAEVPHMAFLVAQQKKQNASYIKA